MTNAIRYPSEDRFDAQRDDRPRAMCWPDTCIAIYDAAWPGATVVRPLSVVPTARGTCRYVDWE